MARIVESLGNGFVVSIGGNATPEDVSDYWAADPREPGDWIPQVRGGKRPHAVAPRRRRAGRARVRQASGLDRLRALSKSDPNRAL